MTEYADETNFNSLNSSQNSTLHGDELLEWKTIKLGKVINGDVFPGNKKKKKKKKRAAEIIDPGAKLLPSS